MRIRLGSLKGLLLACLACTGPADAQEAPWKSHISLGLGISTHPDMDLDPSGLLVAVHYRRNISRYLSWGLFLLRSGADSELDFFDDRARLLQYLNRGDARVGIGSTWARIETYAAGGRLHFNPINGRRHYFSIGAGLGYYHSRSSLQSLEMVREESVYTLDGVLLESRFTEVEGSVGSASRTEPFLYPALNYQFFPGGPFFIGLEAGLFLDLDSEPLTTHPVLANFYALSLHLGMRF